MSSVFRSVAVVAVAATVVCVSVRVVSATREQPLAAVEPDVAQTAESDNAGATDGTGFVVHEWGTFTNYSGSDGIKLEFRPLLENDLPRFVFSRFGQPWSRTLSKSSLRSIQRMETPVTYFYTPVERDVEVRVDFPNGLLTEFFPPVREFLPAAENPQMNLMQRTADLWAPIESDSGPEDLSRKKSSLDWGRVHLIPAASLRARVDDEELSRRIGRHVEELMVDDASRYVHYGAAREVDSAMVQVRHTADSPATKKGVFAGDYFEKFLFYRGVGSFDLPLEMKSDGGGRLTLTNRGDRTIRSLFLVSGSGNDVRFSAYDEIGAGATLELEESAESVSINTLGDAVTKALVAEGLYVKEAKAMVKCWKGSWFAEPGTRLLYMVPQTLTDELLPLHVSPQPDETVRVLVGRMEIMTSEEEARIAGLVERSNQARVRVGQVKPNAFVSPVMNDLLALGRFAEPALVRTEQLANDEQIRTEAKQLIRDLRRATGEK